jgi:hypothetical protein
MKKFEELCRKRFLNCAKRLVKLLELEAPNAILAQEVSMLTARAVPLFGEKVFSSIVYGIACQQKFQFGFCMNESCDSELSTEVELIEGLCNKHIEEEKEQKGESYVSRIDVVKFE